MHNKEQKIINEAKIILCNYCHYYPKSLADSSLSAPRLTWAPNHPAVIPIHQDDQILRNLSAKDYCWSVKHVVQKLRSAGYDVSSAIIHNKYLIVHQLLDEQQWVKMDTSPRTFYRKLNNAILMFGQIMYKLGLLDRFYKMAVK